MSLVRAVIAANAQLVSIPALHDSRFHRHLQRGLPLIHHLSSGFFSFPRHLTAPPILPVPITLISPASARFCSLVSLSRLLCWFCFILFKLACFSTCLPVIHSPAFLHLYVTSDTCINHKNHPAAQTVCIEVLPLLVLIISIQKYYIYVIRKCMEFQAIKFHFFITAIVKCSYLQ